MLRNVLARWETPWGVSAPQDTPMGVYFGSGCIIYARRPVRVLQGCSGGCGGAAAECGVSARCGWCACGPCAGCGGTAGGCAGGCGGAAVVCGVTARCGWYACGVSAECGGAAGGCAGGCGGAVAGMWSCSMWMMCLWSLCRVWWYCLVDVEVL